MLHVHRAERADRLVAALADVVAAPLSDPMDAEVVAVPTRGVERWLTQRLAARLGASDRGEDGTAGGAQDGVCAGVDFPFPGRLVSGVVAAACGLDPNADPWEPERAVWPLLELADARLDEPWLEPLAAHLDAQPAGADAAEAGSLRCDRRFGVLRHLADLYDRYAIHRPAMVRAWAAGADVDAAGAPLADDVAWQARLWRALRAELAVPSPAERIEDAAARLVADPALVTLPERLSAFGLTRLPASYLAVLSALSAGRDVHLFLLHPSPTLWRQAAELGEQLAAAHRRTDVPDSALPHNPLLASWGQDAREMQLVLARSDAPRADHHHRLTLEPSTLLERLQADVHADRPPPGEPPPGQPDRRALLAADDDSVQVHSGHGRARQVEVLRDAILHRLAEDPTLEPRDVVVMCPDIETFAPLIHAAFAASSIGVDTGDGDGAPTAGGQRLPDLRVRLADRSLRRTNPLLAVVAELLELADSRVTASQVLELASREPVRSRFRLTDDDLERLEDWVPKLGVRWGFDAAHRAPWRLGTVTANTWRAGLDRLLVGVAMSEDDRRLVGGTLPHDDVEASDIDLAGRAVELLARLQHAVTTLSGPQPVAAWTRAIADAADALTATADHDAWQSQQLHRLLDEVADEATRDGAPCATPVTLAEVRALLADRLRGRPTRANFRTGHLTVCTLVPMRSVPHRVIGLLGLDDGAFPRRTAPDGDDLVDRDPHVGDREPRSEDRQLLLDALLAATEHLLITYSGHDERSNAPRPPAVPVGELLDTADRTARTGETGEDGAERPVRERVLHRHPLQPFDPRNFSRGAIRRGQPWSFDPVALDGARAAAAGSDEPAPFLPGPLPPPEDDDGVIELDRLVAFVQHPVRAFLRQRLGVSLGDEPEEPDDGLPVELDGLGRWSVGQRLLEARLAGVDEARCVAAERARGTLPPGRLGEPVLDRVVPVVRGLVTAAAQHVGSDAEPTSVDATVTLPDGTQVAGTVAPVTGERLWQVLYSRLAAKHRLVAWVRLLAATAAQPERPLEAVSLGRGADEREPVRCARIPPLGDDPAARAERARAHLADLVDVYRRGMREPLPLYCATSAVYADARRRGRDGRAAARRAWESGYKFDGEDKDREHQLVLGGQLAATELFTELPRGDEHGAGWRDDEPSRFGRYARRLWDGLLELEEVTSR